MSIKESIQAELKTAMKAKEKNTVTVIRSVQAAIKKIEIDKQIELTDEQILDVLQKQIKQRKESLKIYTENDRADLAEKEQAEIEVLTGFMPEPLSLDELSALVEQQIKALEATSMKDMGKVMASLKEKVAGRAEPSDVSKLVKQLLG